MAKRRYWAVVGISGVVLSSCGDSKTSGSGAVAGAGATNAAGTAGAAGSAAGRAGNAGSASSGAGGLEANAGTGADAGRSATGGESEGGAGGAAVNEGPVTALSVGYWHACAIAGGKVLCWGENRSGQLGNGSVAAEDAAELPPVEVQGLGSPVAQISAGHFHTCALIAGSAWCWGLNGHGQLGNDSVVVSALPVKVAALGSSVAALSAGGNHTCAQLQNGAVYCWGYNAMGQVGDGTRVDKHVPVPVLMGAVSLSGIESGEYQTCALAPAGEGSAGGSGGEGGATGDEVACWGQNNIDDAPTVPTVIAGSHGAALVSTGGNHACILVDGEAACWGINHNGVISEQTWIDESATPVLVPSFTGLSAISAGPARSCAIQGGAAFCWGSNYSSGLGDGSDAFERRLPTPVLGLATGVTAIDAGGGDRSCALAHGNAYCWGDGKPTPALVLGLEP